MTNENSEAKILPFKLKPKETPAPQGRQMTMQEFIDDTHQRLTDIENVHISLVKIINQNTKELIKEIEELKSKMRIVWVGFCIGWGLLVGTVLSFISKAFFK